MADNKKTKRQKRKEESFKKLDYHNDQIKRADQIAEKGGTIGKVLGGGKKAYHKIARAWNVIGAVTGINDKSWYTKYGEITPAANINRPMQARMTKEVTSNAADGSICKFVDVYTEWIGWEETFSINQTANNVMTKIRAELRSNIPYDVEKVQKYLVNTISLTIILEMMARDIRFGSQSNPTEFNWLRMYNRIAPISTYGIVGLSSDSRFPFTEDSEAIEAAAALSSYQLLLDMVGDRMFAPGSFPQFAKHYFGNVFIDQTDRHGDQYIRMCMRALPWYSPTQKLRVDPMNVDFKMAQELIDQFRTDNAILIADLMKTNALNTVHLSRADEAPVFVSDPSFLQTLINGYTDGESVTNEGFVRFDRLMEVKDDLTQFLFAGGLYKKAVSSTGLHTSAANYILPITISSMVLKYDSDSDLVWPGSFIQGSTPTTRYSEPIGLVISTSVYSDTVVNISDGEDAMIYALKEGVNNYTHNSAVSSEFSVQNVTIAMDNVATVFATSLSPENIFTKSRGKIPKEPVFVHAFYPLTYVTSKSSNQTIELFVSGIWVHWGKNTDGFVLGSVNTEIEGFSPRAEIVTIKMPNDATSRGTLAYDNVNAILFFSNADVSIQAGSTISGVINDFIISVQGDDKASPLNLRWNINGYQILSARTLESRVGPIPTTEDMLSIPVVISGSSLYVHYDGDALGAPFSVTNLPGNGDRLLLTVSMLGNPAITSFRYGNVVTNIGVDTDDWGSIVSGYGTLVPWVVDQVDWHLPVRNTTRVTVRFADGREQKLEYPPVLIKESYAPYYYNIYDLIPVAYRMFTGLFGT